MTDSPLAIINQVRVDMQMLMDRFCQDGYDQATTKIISLATMIQRAIEIDRDAVIGSVLLWDKNFQYCTNQSINTAIIGELITAEMLWKKDQRLSLIAAALTMNLGIIELQNRLYFHKGGLSNEDREQIRQHPERSVELLRKSGVNDKIWLRTVLHHHELMSGKGYPQKLKGDKIPLPARILAISDIYCSMIAPRDFRTGLAPDKVLMEIFTKRGDLIDVGLSPNFYKGLCIQPPGTLMKLKTGEIVLVVKCNKKRLPNPPVFRIINPKNCADTGKNISPDDYEVEKVYGPRADNSQLDMYKIWGHSSDGEDLARLTGKKPSESEIEKASKAIEGVKIPSLPEIVLKIQSEVNKENPNIANIANWVSEDVALSGEVMKTVSSPLLGIRTKISSIQHGVMILGLKQFTTLVLQSAMKAAMEDVGPNVSAFWDEAKEYAYCASRLSSAVVDIDKDEAYMAGLFVASGSLFLSIKHAEYMEKTESILMTQPYSGLALEEELYGANHATVGYLAAKHWGLPDDICSAICHHHTQDLALVEEKKIGTLAAILALTGFIMDSIHQSDLAIEGELEEFRDKAIEELLVSEDDVDEVKADIIERLGL